jgi:hypothetical protein
VKWADDAARVEKPGDQIEAELKALDASAEVQCELRRTLADVLFRMA